MKRRNPPALAVWLLNRLGVSARNEPLTGDLLEEFRSGRTASWYWRQTLMAILTALVQRVSELRLELKVLIIGWGAQAGVLLVLRWCRVPFELLSIGLLTAAAIAIMLVCYASMEISARALIERDDLNEMEFREQLCRAVFPRVMAVGWFVAFMVFDGWIVLVMKTSPLLEIWFPFLAVGPEIPLGFPLLFAANACGLCWYVGKILSSPPGSWFRVRRS